jgi:hypothetical protein
MTFRPSSRIYSPFTEEQRLGSCRTDPRERIQVALSRLACWVVEGGEAFGCDKFSKSQGSKFNWNFGKRGELIR